MLVSRNADLGFEPVPLPTQAFSQAFKRTSPPPVKPARAFELYMTLLFLCVTLALYLLKQFLPPISKARSTHQTTVRSQNKKKKRSEQFVRGRPEKHGDILHNVQLSLSHWGTFYYVDVIFDYSLNSSYRSFNRKLKVIISGATISILTSTDVPTKRMRRRPKRRRKEKEEDEDDDEENEGEREGDEKEEEED